jgi:hypothetical protein
MKNNDELLARASELNAVIDAARLEAPPPSGILHVSMLNPASSIAADGSAAQAVVNQGTWEQIYAELYRGASREAASLLPSPDDLDERVRAYSRQNVVPIFVGHFTYHSVATLFENLVKTDFAGGQAFAVPTRDQLLGAWEEKTAFFASARLQDVFREYTLLPHVHHGLAVDFVLPSDGCLGNASALEDAEIDFGDGRGARPITLDRVERAEYSNSGTKRLVLTARAGGQRLLAQFDFEVGEAVRCPQPTVWTDLTFPVHFGKVTTNAVGHAWVLLGEGHTRLQEPIFICDGFPGHDVEHFCDVWDLLNAEGFADSLLKAGRDLVIVSYDGKAYIEANAGVLIAAIRRALKERTGNSKLIVGGASMGGLVARFGLAYMQANRMPEMSKIDTYFSFDSPHLGASFPLSAQFLLYAFRGQSAADKVRALINSIASREMLLYWVDNDGKVQPEQQNQIRQAFIRHLDEVGNFAATANKFAVANGDGIGFANYTPASQEVLEWVLPGEFSAWARALMYSAQGVVESGGKDPVYFCGGPWPDERDKYRTSVDVPRIDSAPGGTDDFFEQIGTMLGESKDPFGFSKPANVIYKSSCFIPTISALAMPLDPTKQADLYQDLSAHRFKTPFTDYMFSELNTPHVTVTPEIKLWLLNRLGIDVEPSRLITELSGSSNDSSGSTELFAIGEGGQLLHRYYHCDSSGTCGWSDWSTTLDGVAAPAPAAQILAASNPLDRTVQLLLISTERQLWHNFYDSRWNGWPRGASNPVRFNGKVNSIAAVPNNKGKRFQLFLMDNSDTLYTNSLENRRWSGWGSALVGGIVGMFPVLNPRNGNIEIFVVTRDKKLAHAYFDGTRFSGFTTGGPLAHDNVASVFAAANSSNNNLEVFLITTGHHLYHNYYDGNWHEWSDSGRLKFRDNTAAEVFAMEDDVRRGIYAFLLTTDQLLYVTNYQDGQWQDWSAKRAGLELPTRVKSVFALRNKTQPDVPRIEAFAISSSQALYHNSFRFDGSQNRWSGWNYWAVPVQQQVQAKLLTTAS